MPAPGWKKKTKSPSGVGLTLLNIRKAAHKAYNDAEDKAGKEVLESVLEVRDFDVVMEQAELAGRLFAANNPLPDLLINSEVNQENLSPSEQREQRHVEEALHRASLVVPRRPKWIPGMTAEELDVEERKAFLSWRRGLARLEENEKLVITPFEKNLDIWRQLWRVLERSDLIVLVVDSRNPLFYRSPDLEAYVRELDRNKKVMLLLNKADLLTASSRQEWAAYFKSQGVPFLFWSAKAATAILEGKAESTTTDSLQRSLVVEADDAINVFGREELLQRLQKEAEAIVSLQREASKTALSKHVSGKSLDMNGDLVSEGQQGPAESRGNLETSRRVVVGFVGYPNVGKSSTINALVGEKKTGVTSTPGKTKHFQTLIINDKLMLCDCPGLVFPSFSSSKSEMVASGVLPIDKLTDHRGPVQVVADNVPRAALEAIYGISLPKPKLYEDQSRPPSAAELLFVFAVSRGYFANGGLPDETRAARLILKDYLSGKLPYCHSPPSTSDASASAANVDAQIDQVSSEDDLEQAKDLSGEKEGEETDEDDEISVSALSRISLKEQEEMQPGSRPTSKDAETAESAGQLLGVVDNTGDNLARVFEDLDSSVGSDLKGKSGKAEKSSSTPHKMHKKAVRKKDRSWRAGGKQSVIPQVNGVKIPVSHGAADRYQVQVFE
ncbi:unnamed protein product [Calypogeia fissa]